MTTPNTQEEAVLDPSAAGSGVSGVTSGTPDDPQTRLNGLMSLYNKEQAERQRAETEITRLQGILATSVSGEATLNQRIAELAAGQSDALTAAAKRAEDAETARAAAEAQAAQLTAKNARLAVIAANPDIAAYADILPESSDVDALNRAVSVIRAARQAETDAVKSHFGGNPPRGGQPPRTGKITMSPAEISEYLKSAPRGEFEKRLAEVTGN